MTAKSKQQSTGGQRTRLGSSRPACRLWAGPHSSKLPSWLPSNAAVKVSCSCTSGRTVQRSIATRETPSHAGPMGCSVPTQLRSKSPWRRLTSMLVGGIAALLLQNAAPGGPRGSVGAHSFPDKTCMERLRRTARFQLRSTTYGGRAEGETLIARVRRIHDSVQGLLANGSAYKANDPSLLGLSTCNRKP